jgi:hypothetical protein
MAFCWVIWGPKTKLITQNFEIQVPKGRIYRIYHRSILSAFLLSNLGFQNNYILKISKSVQFEVLLIQISNFEVSFHSVQYDERIHAPDLHIRFFFNKWNRKTNLRSQLLVI